MSNENQSPILSLKNVEKSYSIGSSTLPILKGISLDLFPGSFTSIQGPSGAGKTTLLNLMGLLDFPSQGEVFFMDKKVDHLSQGQRAKLRREFIGFIFQNFQLLPELNVMENVCLPGLLLKRSNHELKKVGASLLDQMGLLDRQHHFPSQLSGGEKQRAAICRALINHPKVILADEPTGNLDSENANQIETLLETLTQEQNVSLILVTHNESLAKRANKIVALEDGIIL